MCRAKLKHHLLCFFFLIACLASNLFFAQPAFAQSKCGTGHLRMGVGHLFNSTFHYSSTSGTEKTLLDVENTLQNTIDLECPPGITLYAVTESNKGPIINDILPTGEPGVGVRLIIDGRTFSGRQELGDGIRYDTVNMQIMQYGPIASGSVSMAHYTIGNVRIYGSDDPVNPLASISISTFGRATFRDVMCRLDNNITQVTLRNALLSEFKGASTRLAPQSFSIGISKCATTVGSYNLSYRVDPMHTSFGQGVSGPSPDSTAKGIGIQILNPGLKTLEFGTNYPVIGSGSNRSIDLYAAYYQLENKPSAGTVNASFMLTLMVN